MKNKNQDLFHYKDYRAYLNAALPVKGDERGARTKLATFLGCQSGFVSQVLSGLADFSFEHAMKISRFLGHSKEEKAYFLLLVHFARAGSKDLRDHYEEQIQAILTKRKDIRERVYAVKPGISDEDKQLYYSSWHYTAVHMCLVIPTMQTKKAVAEYLNLSLETVSRILSDLLRIGLAKQDGDRYIGNYDRLHLSQDSPLISKHHTNWRMQAIQSLDSPRANDLHYSLVMSISREAAEKMREILLNSIQSMEPIMRDARDEAVYSFNIDLFELQS